MKSEWPQNETELAILRPKKKARHSARRTDTQRMCESENGGLKSDKELVREEEYV